MKKYALIALIAFCSPLWGTNLQIAGLLEFYIHDMKPQTAELLRTNNPKAKEILETLKQAKNILQSIDTLSGEEIAQRMEIWRKNIHQNNPGYTIILQEKLNESLIQEEKKEILRLEFQAYEHGEDHKFDLQIATLEPALSKIQELKTKLNLEKHHHILDFLKEGEVLDLIDLLCAYFKTKNFEKAKEIFPSVMENVDKSPHTHMSFLPISALNHYFMGKNIDRAKEKLSFSTQKQNPEYWFVASLIYKHTLPKKEFKEYIEIARKSILTELNKLSEGEKKDFFENFTFIKFLFGPDSHKEIDATYSLLELKNPWSRVKKKHAKKPPIIIPPVENIDAKKRVFIPLMPAPKMSVISAIEQGDFDMAKALIENGWNTIGALKAAEKISPEYAREIKKCITDSFKNFSKKPLSLKHKYENQG